MCRLPHISLYPDEILKLNFSQKYCGDVELPVPRSKNGVTSFEFPFTPLARRIYNEEEDREMDIWINIRTRAQERTEVGDKTLTLVVTPFKEYNVTNALI